MKNLIILDQFLPNPKANGICITNIINYFADSSNDVVCRVYDQTFDSMQTVKKPFNKVFVVKDHKEKNYSQSSLFCKIIYIFKHVFSTFLAPIYHNGLVKKYFVKACEAISLGLYDNIICLLNPIEAVETGFRIKKNFQW